MNDHPAFSLTFIQQANKHRKSLLKQLQPSKPISLTQILPPLLNFHLLLYDSQYDIECKSVLNKSTSNLVSLIGAQLDNQENKNGERKKFNVKWRKKMGKDQKNQNVNRGEEKGQVRKNQGIMMGNCDEKDVKQGKQEDNKKKPAEFVSANSLPKGTSIRKKFVPPFKKTEKQEEKGIKIPADNKEGDDQMDPRFKNLQAKLVQIIESEIVEKGKKIEWGQIAGLGFAKKIIHEMIVWPMLRPDIFTGLRAPPKGILLFGPPGTGKTMIGRAIASEAHATFFSISASSLTSKWVGQSEKLVRTLFAVARAKQPSVIFIDQIDSLLCSRRQGEQESSRKVKTEFLIELDGAKTNSQERILIIGATNLPQQLDDAVRRRFVKRLYIPLPNLEGRVQLIQSLTKHSSFSLEEEDIKKIALLTKGYSGADMYNLCSQSSLMPLREFTSIQNIKSAEVPTTKLTHFEQAINLVRPSVNTELLFSFEQWNKNYGSYQLSPDELEQNLENPYGFGLQQKK